MSISAQASSPPPLPSDPTGTIVFLWFLPIVMIVGVMYKLFGLPLPTCIFQGVSSLPCPTCGMSRGFDLLLAGNISGAASMNPLTILLPLILLFFWIALLMRHLGCLPSELLRLNGNKSLVAIRVFFVVVVAGVWIYLLAVRFA